MFLLFSFLQNKACWKYSWKSSSIVIVHSHFIHKYHSSMTCERIFFHITKYFVLGVTKYSLNILSMWEEYSKKDSVLLPCSCSQAHEIVSLYFYKRTSKIIFHKVCTPLRNNIFECALEQINNVIIFHFFIGYKDTFKDFNMNIKKFILLIR